MRSRPVPTEVAERVLDDLGIQEDVRTLSTCARVCHSWVPRATFNLWHKVTIHGKNGLDSVRTALEHSPQLSRFIHAVRLEDEDPDDFPHTALAFLFPFIGSRITSLEMYSKYDGIRFPSAVFSRLQHYTALKTLMVYYQIFPTHHHVRRIFRALPALDTLELSEFHDIDNRPVHDWSFVPGKQPSLKNFVIILDSDFAYLFHFDIDQKYAVDTSLDLSRLVQNHAKYSNGNFGITFIIKNSTMNLRDRFRMWLQRLLSPLHEQDLLHIVFENYDEVPIGYNRPLRERSVVDMGDDILASAWSPDGAYILTLMRGGDIFVVDPENTKHLHFKRPCRMTEDKSDPHARLSVHISNGRLYALVEVLCNMASEYVEAWDLSSAKYQPRFGADVEGLPGHYAEIFQAVLRREEGCGTPAVLAVTTNGTLLVDSGADDEPAGTPLAAYKRFSDLHLAHLISHALGRTLFLFLHGLEDDNESQSSSFAAARTPQVGLIRATVDVHLSARGQRVFDRGGPSVYLGNQ
ncbi:uncharacterized protein BXZ73DRAFT_102155 [Epithele typhae]|uniref:uncharacterized protein n=1 Tax=Epithele typhae TaxID=378194 RepID=UPI002008CFA1|nr:uncharacterized protein BXZ73DRAFT_102155 [Epithele typhae]KAH9928999.1 hypothetical protein BXZ73DRAFT_102155 [Epithele typhae]